MRIVLALVSLFAISCSTSNKYIFHCGDTADCCPAFADTDDDGLPDKRVSTTDCCPEDEHVETIAIATARDADDDGLPDQRIIELVLVDDEDEVGIEVREVQTDPRQDRGHNERLERALEDLQRAIEIVRRAMR